MDRNAGKPSRELRASLETADIFKRLQEHFLGCVAGIFGIAQEPSQSPEYPPRMPANQLLKAVDVSALDSRDKGGIRVVGKSGIYDGTGFVAQRIQIFWAKHPPWRKIGHGPDPRLYCVQEVGQARHHDCLYDLNLRKAVGAKSLRLEALARPPWEAREFAGFVKQGPIRARYAAAVIFDDPVGLL